MRPQSRRRYSQARQPETRKACSGGPERCRCRRERSRESPAEGRRRIPSSCRRAARSRPAARPPASAPGRRPDTNSGTVTRSESVGYPALWRAFPARPWASRRSRCPHVRCAHRLVVRAAAADRCWRKSTPCTDRAGRPSCHVRRRSAGASAVPALRRSQPSPRLPSSPEASSDR